MDSTDIKELIIKSLNSGADSTEAARKLNEMSLSFDFSNGFSDRIIQRISVPVKKLTREMEFVKYLNFAFYRIALTGVAAIIVLMISIFLMEGSLSLNAFLGLTDSYDESIVYLLTGN